MVSKVVDPFAGGSEAGPKEGVYVPINNSSFGTISARPGQTITIANWDGFPHAVTAGTPESPTGQFHSGALGTGEAFEVSFDEPGHYSIYCTIQPSKTTTIVVQ